MIWFINWQIKNIENNSCIILTSSWLGYELIINELIYSNIFQKTDIKLYVYHHITENWQSLFGFLNIDDRNIFKELIKISWVWWKVAQVILSLWTDKLKQAIVEEDKKTLETIKWVWKKMAEKIIIELKDKDFVKNISIKKEKNLQNISIPNDIKKQVISTLWAMWYNINDIEKTFWTLPENLTTINDIIPYIIKNI